MNLAAARMKRFQLNHLGEDLNDAIQHFTFAVLVTLPDSPLLPSRLAALGSALGQAGDEESVAHGTDLLLFASSLEGDAARRTSLVARLVAGTWERHQRFRSPESLEATLNARRLVEQWTNSPGDPGQIRIEAHSITSGIVDGQQGRSFPFSHLLPTAGSPSATVVSIGGVAVSPNPATFPDIVINKLTAVDVVIQTRNVPTTATINSRS